MSIDLRSEAPEWPPLIKMESQSEAPSNRSQNDTVVLETYNTGQTEISDEEAPEEEKDNSKFDTS